MNTHILTADCGCIECTDIDWDAPCINCGVPQRDCCGCHEGYQTAECIAKNGKE